jgi:hypothetical protein
MKLGQATSTPDLDETVAACQSILDGTQQPAPVTKLGDVAVFAVVASNGGYCRRCGRALKSEKWAALGIGPVCATKEANDTQTRFLDSRGRPVFDLTHVSLEQQVVDDIGLIPMVQRLQAESAGLA